MNDFVYFIKPVGFDGPVKIGCSKSPSARKIALGQWCPFPLEIIAQIKGDYHLERRFHALFGLQHKQREWFDWSPLMAEVVSAINAGTFDIETLPPPKGVPTQRGIPQREAAARKKLAQSTTTIGTTAREYGRAAGFVVGR